MRDCPEKRKVPGNKGQKVTGCFRCRSVKHSVRNISQSAAAEKLGFWVEGADRERGWGLVLCHGNTVSQAYRGHLSSAEDVLLISACELKDRLDLSRAAGNKLTSHRMLVMQAVLNGHCIFCLVDTLSEWTLVSQSCQHYDFSSRLRFFQHSCDFSTIFFSHPAFYDILSAILSFVSKLFPPTSLIDR